ncbi:right-handed parallel beta-helix repeat-containing protein [Pseudonocardia sp. MH-G8]|uniref:right-handed parallel beta-helix repeat-containing protein n=1 Tax=Pseudonocardia sp. MH-G8 TaxID=1854588 RepID=UPI000B9FE154|nr:right-handed parallel beta-helix repeat-containing protein [Pseudonocardia sp. MH-G8]
MTEEIERETMKTRYTGASGHGMLRGATLIVLAVAFSLAATACSAPAPEPLDRREVAAADPVDPTRPCSRQAPAQGPPDSAPSGVGARFDRAANTIELVAGDQATLPAVAEAVGDPAALREVAPGEWLLDADLVIMPGATLLITAPAVSWLKLASEGSRNASLKALGGTLDINGSCITSWDVAQDRVDTEYADGRGYLLARDGAQMAIERAELRFLGSADVESYGLSWRTDGTNGKITNSDVSHNYFGLYSYEVSGLVVADNEFHDNVLYGVDPHTGSRNLVIERNTVYNNGKHGIILAEDVTDSVVRNNVVYANKHHGIVLYLRSDRNLIENNDSFGNTAQGININESSDNTVRGNRVYDNDESGIGVGQTAQGNVVERNQIRGNQQDGVRLVSESMRTAVRDNVIGENGRYGIYVDVDGDVDIAENTIFGSSAGIMLKGSPLDPSGENQVFGNREGDVLSD